MPKDLREMNRDCGKWSKDRGGGGGIVVMMGRTIVKGGVIEIMGTLNGIQTLTT
jgi:hypothetical protein